MAARTGEARRRPRRPPLQNEGEGEGEAERARGFWAWVEVGGEEVEASRGGVDLILLVDGEVVRRGRCPCSGAHQGNRKGARFGELGRPGW